MHSSSPSPQPSGPRFTLRPQVFFVIALLYPLAYSLPMIANGVGYNFSNMFFLSLGAALFLLCAVVARPVIARRDLVNLLLLICTFAIVLAATRSPQFLKPISFYAFCIVSYGYLMFTRGRNPGLIPVVIGLLYALAGTLFMLDEARFAVLGRYSGFTISPTVFSVWLQAVLLIVLLGRAHPTIKVVLFITFSVFIFASQTRLNIAFMTLLPLLLLFGRQVWRLRLLVFVGFLLTLNLVYPLVGAYQELHGGGLLSARYAGGRDGSTLFRLAMSAALVNHLLDAGPLTLLFGSGSGAARDVMAATFGYDLLPHNDYLQLVTDFGIVTVALHLTFFYRVAKRNRSAFYLLLLYLVTFYHNMVFSYFLAFLILYFGLAIGDREASSLPVTLPAGAAPVR